MIDTIIVVVGLIALAVLAWAWGYYAGHQDGKVTGSLETTDRLLARYKDAESE